MTSAINGRIFFKQDNRAYLEANKRTNSLVFDLDNNTLLYSPSGTNYYEFFSGRGSTASNSTSGYLTSSDWNTFNNKADISSVYSIVSANVSSTISAYGFIDMGGYTQVNKPLRLSNGVIFAPFVQRYISGTPSVSSMVISAGISQRIQLPSGTSYRLWWYGVGPFSYRTGDSNVASMPSDFPAMVGYTQILNTTDSYLAVYGVGSGSITIEAGDGAV